MEQSEGAGTGGKTSVETGNPKQPKKRGTLSARESQVSSSLGEAREEKRRKKKLKEEK